MSEPVEHRDPLTFEEWRGKWNRGWVLYLVDVTRGIPVENKGKGIRLGIITDVTALGILVQIPAIGHNFVPWPHYPYWVAQHPNDDEKEATR